MSNPEELVAGISAYINFVFKKSNKSQHFFYIVAEDIGINKDDLKNSFNYFIERKIDNTKFLSLDKITNDFQQKTELDKKNYFSLDYIYVVDCATINENNLSIFNSIFEIAKDKKLSFIYYSTVKKMHDCLLTTPQYSIKAGLYGKIEQEIFKYYEYNTLKEEIKSNSYNTTSLKRNKL
jgi:hypothetical protein